MEKIELKPHDMWLIPTDNEHLWELIGRLSNDHAAHAAMFMHNYIASQYQAGNIKPIERENNEKHT